MLLRTCHPMGCLSCLMKRAPLFHHPPLSPEMSIIILLITLFGRLALPVPPVPKQDLVWSAVHTPEPTDIGR